MGDAAQTSASSSFPISGLYFPPILAGFVAPVAWGKRFGRREAIDGTESAAPQVGPGLAQPAGTPRAAQQAAAQAEQRTAISTSRGFVDFLAAIA